MDDTVSIDTIITLVKRSGADAVLEGDQLKIYPQDGDVRVFIVPPGGLGRRVIIEIGRRTGVKSHLFWHPERALLVGERSEADRISDAPTSQFKATRA